VIFLAGARLHSRVLHQPTKMRPKPALHPGHYPWSWNGYWWPGDREAGKSSFNFNWFCLLPLHV